MSSEMTHLVPRAKAVAAIERNGDDALLKAAPRSPLRMPFVGKTLMAAANARALANDEELMQQTRQPKAPGERWQEEGRTPAKIPMFPCSDDGPYQFGAPDVPARLGLLALRRWLSAPPAPMFDDRVRTWKHQAGMTVVETHQIGRFPARSANLDDLARPLGLTHDVATHAEPVSDGCLHQPTSSPALCVPPAHRGGTLAVWCHITMASTHLAAG